jgi:hypothetical protein
MLTIILLSLFFFIPNCEYINDLFNSEDLENPYYEEPELITVLVEYKRVYDDCETNDRNNPPVFLQGLGSNEKLVRATKDKYYIQKENIKTGEPFWNAVFVIDNKFTIVNVHSNCNIRARKMWFNSIPVPEDKYHEKDGEYVKVWFENDGTPHFY